MTAGNHNQPVLSPCQVFKFAVPKLLIPVLNDWIWEHL